MSISEKLRQQVIAQADYRCEYCKTFSRLTGIPLVMEHRLNNENVVEARAMWIEAGWHPPTDG